VQRGKGGENAHFGRKATKRRGHLRPHAGRHQKCKKVTRASKRRGPTQRGEKVMREARKAKDKSLEKNHGGGVGGFERRKPLKMACNRRGDREKKPKG